MAKLKSVLDLIAEILVNLREDQGVNTFPFVFLWANDNKAIDVYVERDDGTYKYRITSPEVELVKDITSEQGPAIEEYTLTGAIYVNPRNRRVEKLEPGECIGVGALLYDVLPTDYLNAREAITHALRRYVEDKDIRTLI